MSEITFDILSYMSGLTGFTFDKAVLTRIAFERGVSEVTEYSALTQENKDLITADLLLTAYLSPNTWASFQQTHGSYTKTIGSQTINFKSKEQIYNYLYKIYTQYEDEDKLAMLSDNSSDVVFLDI